MCFYYHNRWDRRRDIQRFSYYSKYCQSTQDKSNNYYCPYQDDCMFSHNNSEHFFHPENYKKIICSNKDYCKYGNNCSFAHSKEELRIHLIDEEYINDYFIKYLYKTVYCPYLWEHKKNKCVFAHNIQDYRRNPLIFGYEEDNCKNWERKEELHTRNYIDGCCYMGMQC